MQLSVSEEHVEDSVLPVEERVVVELVSLRTSAEVFLKICVATEFVDEVVRVVEVVDASPGIPNTVC